MRLGGVARAFSAGFRNWDLRSKTAFLMAAALLVIVLLIGGRLAEQHRSAVVIAIVGLLVMMQAIFLYANRGMVANATRAQRLMLAGRYQDAAALLETDADGQDVQALTLLGSAYRMLGRLDDSRQVLTKALQIAPNHHFARYSFGRTLVASGQYSDASDVFQQALNAGSPPFARVDLAEANYRAGRTVEPVEDDSFEPHVALMAAYVAWRDGRGEAPSAALIGAGLPYWEKTAARFAHTPYGSDLERDLAVLRGILT